MGTEQYLIAEGSDEVFDLGKERDGFHCAFGEPRQFVELGDGLGARLYEEAKEGLWEDPDKLEVFCNEVAIDIRKWANGRRVMWVTEHDEIMLGGRKITGSRYGPKDDGIGLVFGQEDDPNRTGWGSHSPGDELYRVLEWLSEQKDVYIGFGPVEEKSRRGLNIYMETGKPVAGDLVEMSLRGAVVTIWNDDPSNVQSRKIRGVQVSLRKALDESNREKEQ